MNQPSQLKLLILSVSLLFLSNCARIDNIPMDTPTAASTTTPTPAATATSTLLLPTPTAMPTIAAISNAPTATPTVTRTPRRRQSDLLPTLSPTPTATPVPGVACVINATELNLREGPGTGYQSITTLSAGQDIFAQKCLPDGTWLLVQTKQQQLGWIYKDFVTCQPGLPDLPTAQGFGVVGGIADAGGNFVNASATIAPASTPVPTPAGTATPAIPLNRWRGEYYDNASLLGEPVLVREDETLEFNWILDSPDPRIPGDNFSVRWTGIFDFVESGDYRFFAEVDDGIRVYVDGWLVIDAWHTTLSVPYEGDFSDLQAGPHTMVVEYFESGGHARIKVWAKRDTFADANWHGEYYNNLDFQDPVVYSESAPTIDFDWGGSAPNNSITNNNFSVRWSRTLFFDPGDYRFFADVEDEDFVRVTLDGWEIFSEYRKNDGRVEGNFGDLGAGYHNLQVEFQDRGDKAKIKFWWEKR